MIYCCGFSSLKYYLNNVEYGKLVKEATVSFHECPGGVMVIMFVFHLKIWGQITVKPRLSRPRLSGLFDYPDFFSGPVFFMNINKL